MAKEYTPIDAREVFDTPEYQEKIELLFGGRAGRYVLGLTPEASTIVEAIGDESVLTAPTMDGELIIIPDANPDIKETRSFVTIFNPMSEFDIWDDLIVKGYLAKHLKVEGFFSFKGHWDADLEWLVFPLKGGKEVKW